MVNLSKALAFVLISVALVTVVTLSDLSIKNVNNISLQGELYRAYPYSGGILAVTTNADYTNNTVYFVTQSGETEIASFSNTSASVYTIVISNSSTAVLDAVFMPSSYTSLQQLINNTKTNITILNGEQIVGSKFFDNFTIGLPSPNGIIYVTYEPNDTTKLEPENIITYGYVIGVYPTQYGLLIINSSVPSINEISTGQGNELSSATISLLGKWSMNVNGYQGSSMANNLLVVSNATSTFIVNVNNEKITDSINISGLILKDSTLVKNNTLYQIVGEPLNGNGAQLVILNLTSGKYTTLPTISGYLLENAEYGKNYVFVSGLNSYNNLITVAMNYSGQVIYSKIISSNLPFVQPYDAVYSGGYIYVLTGSQTESGTLTNVKIIQIVIPPTTTSTTTSTTTTTVPPTTTTSTTSTTTTTTSTTTTSTTTTSTTTTSTTTTTTSTSTTTTSTTTTPTTTSSTTTTPTTTPTSITTTSTKVSTNLALYIGIGVIIIIVIGLVALLLRRR